jgi:hypothetical protein
MPLTPLTPLTPLMPLVPLVPFVGCSNSAAAVSRPSSSTKPTRRFVPPLERLGQQRLRAFQPWKGTKTYMSIAKWLERGWSAHDALPILMVQMTTAQGGKGTSTYRPRPCSPIGRKMDSDMGVGRNWSSDSAESFLKVERKRWDSTCAVSRSIRSGSRKESMLEMPDDAPAVPEDAMRGSRCVSCREMEVEVENGERYRTRTRGVCLSWAKKRPCLLRPSNV